MFVKLLTIVFFFFSLLSQLLKSSSQSVNNFTYNGFHLPLTLISIQGKAAVTPNGLLKLTHSTMYMTGHAFYNQPIRFKDSPNSTVSSFSTTFVFAIIPQVKTFSGDGMAFFVAPTSSPPSGNPGEYLGLFTPLNNVHPRDDETGQFKDLTLISSQRMQVWVDYDGLTNQIDVTMAPFNHDKPIKPLVSTVRDLSSILLQDMFVGFSASTGAVVSQHFILGWSFQVKGKAPPLDLQTLPKLPELQSKRKGIPPLTAFYFAVTLLALLFFLSLLLREFVKFIFRRKIKFVEEEEELEDWETEFTKNRVKFKDLYSATEGFKEKDVLGSGGFGSVYKGVMPNTKKEIAVKRVSNESKQGLKEFVSESPELSPSFRLLPSGKGASSSVRLHAQWKLRQVFA
ncbi:unnamed protein product [Brassica rapa subsp. trilocularis]